MAAAELFSGVRRKSEYESPAIELWRSVRVGDVANRLKKAITIDTNDTIHTAVQVLAVNDISSAPVLDKSTNTFTRFLDFKNLAQTVYQFIKEDKESAGKMMRKVDIKIIPVHREDLTSQQPFFSVKDDEPLWNAVRFFTQKHTHNKVYRLFVLSSSSSLVNLYSLESFVSILSQSDAVRFLSQHLNDERIKTTSHKTLSELKLVQKVVSKVTVSKPVFGALEIMLQRNISSLAVVSDDDKLFGAITFSHIQYAFQQKNLVAELFKPVGEFLAQVQSVTSEDSKSGDKKETYSTDLMSVTPSTTLTDVIKRVVSLRMHRVWIVNDDNHVIGVVSLTDIINAFT